MVSQLSRPWTNRSVLQFAEGRDPVSTIEAMARELVLRARDAGWAGPPYNPVAIADLLNIPVEANSDVADARTVSSGSRLRIEFNPIKPRERVRFSIAHEIAHTLFPDVGEEVRHRGGTPEVIDDWQLEMLCNVAAAEFVMPIGSLSSSVSVPSIEELMIERRRFDVSAEAFLIRVAKTTSEPVSIFVASPRTSAEGEVKYVIDYVVRSRTGADDLRPGMRVPLGSIVQTCTAIGQTNNAIEDWVTGSPAKIECVGIPGFIGAIYPRVAGMARVTSSQFPDPIRYLQGDALSPVGTGPKLICQLVNDQARAWGGGLAKLAARKHPAAQQSYSEWFSKLRKADRLGKVHVTSIGSDLLLASLVAQEGYGPSLFPRLRYAPLEQCFIEVADVSLSHNATVHMPRVGTGQSGGSWPTVEELVHDCIVTRGLSVTVYDLPPRRQDDSTGQLF